MDNVKRLGDCHLGKPFKNGVPLHRRGDRAVLQWEEFEQHLMECAGVELHIQMGDLFDEAVVPYGVIYRAAQIYNRAAHVNVDTTYVVLMGNHDANRDLEKVTAFTLFGAMVCDRVKVVQERPWIEYVGKARHVLVPWHPVLTAAEMIEKHPDHIRDADAVYGHWDVVMGGDNQIPSALLKKLGVKRAYTGHDHLARELELDGLSITVVGSMQPYSHSEDPDERFYVTRDLADVLPNLDGFKDKHLRVRLTGAEQLDVTIDCLQLSTIRDGQDEETVSVADVQFEAFDFEALLTQAVAQVGLRDDLAVTIRGRLQDARMGEDG